MNWADTAYRRTFTAYRPSALQPLALVKLNQAQASIEPEKGDTKGQHNPSWQGAGYNGQTQPRYPGLTKQMHYSGYFYHDEPVHFKPRQLARQNSGFAGHRRDAQP